jgi:hypothetical protein
VALELGDRDTAASVIVAVVTVASATPGDDARGEQHRADKRECPQSPPVD